MLSVFRIDSQDHRLSSERNRECRFPVPLSELPGRSRKFPVRARGEFVSNYLDPHWTLLRIGLCGGRNRRDSLYFPCLSGNRPQRRVRP